MTFVKISQNLQKTTVPESLCYLSCRRLKKEAPAQVLSYDFFEIFSEEVFS